jgi:hypothetical protein
MSKQQRQGPIRDVHVCVDETWYQCASRPVHLAARPQAGAKVAGADRGYPPAAHGEGRPRRDAPVTVHDADVPKCEIRSVWRGTRHDARRRKKEQGAKHERA